MIISYSRLLACVSVLHLYLLLFFSYYVNLTGWIERKEISVPHCCKFCKCEDWDQAKASYLSNWPRLKKSFNWRPHSCWFLCAKNYKAGQTSDDLRFSLFFLFPGQTSEFSHVYSFIRLMSCGHSVGHPFE